MKCDVRYSAMPSALLLSVVLLLLPIAVVHCQQWGDPKFVSENTENISLAAFNEAVLQQDVWMVEEIPAPFVLLCLNYQGPPEPSIRQAPSNLEVELKRANDDRWCIYINRRQDYEVDKHSNVIFLVVENPAIPYTISVTLVNVLDNAPVMTAEGACEIEELRADFDTDCLFNVYHADGYEVNGIGNSSTNELSFAIDDAAGAGEHFQYVASTQTHPQPNYNKLYHLRVIKALDYTEKAIFNFITTVYDLERTHSFNMSTIIQVRNVDSRPPIFSRPFTSERIMEKNKFETRVVAIDRDTGLNKPICYELTTADPKYQKYFEIGQTDGLLTVLPIDRDAEQNELYIFTIEAYKCHNKLLSTSSEGAIILEDINDNFPEIAMSPIELDFWENTVMELNFDQFTINDRDLGEHARYNVRLTETVAGVQQATTSFTIIPESGYQLVSFTINIINASLLDYELPERQTFLLHVTAQEPIELTHQNTQTVAIRLRNWNDEVPKFSGEYYQTSVLETVGAETLLATVAITDRDVDDSIKLTVLGRLSESLQVIQLPVSIDPTSSEPLYQFEIKTKQADIFDYDIANEVIVQLQGEDTLRTEKNEPIHQIFSQLTITVIDVNNKPPQISLPRSTMHILENSVAESEVIIGEEEVAQIIGTDPDTEAELEFSIDWSNSYGTKSGVRAKAETYENCFYIHEVKENRQRTIGTIRVNPEFQQDVDYEMYDTLFLSIRLIDRNQTIMPNMAETVVAIQIDDENDNPPFFANETLTVERSVKEQSDSGVTIGNIIAYDIDGPGNNEMTFTMEPLDPAHKDWMEIDQNGIIRVKANQSIDCDTPPTNVVLQKVTVSDWKWSTSHDFTIVLMDTNNKQPYHDPFPDEGRVYKFEKIPSNTEIVLVEGKDKDRDVPYHTVSYEINYRDFPQLQRYFEVDSGGRVYVKENNDLLDRDAGLASIMINIVMVDNAGGFGIQNRVSTNINVMLLDINDHYPELPALTTDELQVSEDFKQNYIMKANFTAIDLDDRETPNAKINYYVRQILPARETAIFTLERIDEYSASLKVAQDLKGFHGTYTLEVEACDRGSEYRPDIELPTPAVNNCATRDYEVVVMPFNYNSPTITYPTRNAQIRLKYESLKNGTTLVDTNGSNLPNFAAVDDDGGIYGHVTFSLRSTNDNDKDHEIFRVEPVDEKSGRLVLENDQAVEPFPKNYSLTVIARDGGDKQTETSIYIVFINMTGEPAFLQTSFDTNFTENEDGLDEIRQLPFAEDPKNAGLPPGAQTNVFYFIDVKYGNASHLFALDAETNVLRLARMLDREEIPSHEIRIVATNNENGPPATVVDESSPSVLVVRIKVNDVNDNPPVFQQRFYAAGITTNDRVQKPLFRVYAEDPDEDEIIRYEVVDGSEQAVGENLQTDTLPFRLHETSGELTLVQKVQPNQKGYYQFTIIAFDKDDTHNDTVEAKVYIVSESNRVTFVFLNSVEEIDQPDVRDFLALQLSASYGMQCNIDDIDQALIERQEGSGSSTALTDVRTHFIQDNQAVEASRIQQRSSNRTFVTELKASLRLRNLSLQDVPPPTAESLSEADETLQIILIVVSAALAVLCVILFVAFFIKIRSLNRQLKALSATDFGSISSELNGKPTRNVPTTNIFSIEGSNPVLNDNEFGRKGGGVYDDLSLQSEESDFTDMDKDIFSPKRKESLNPAFLEHLRQRSLNPMANGRDKSIEVIDGSNHKKLDETDDELSHRF
ncbi:cadherin-23-like isoform X2 [Anopheles funestus]|uniref:cadherin-23-like isoform X2 n=1 Tax=Anopheles funestus TaxID=62324 RepID=UPI0020C626AA|nr:cadherin-23-like isoform X2 [Anopheles funestus]